MAGANAEREGRTIVTLTSAGCLAGSIAGSPQRGGLSASMGARAAHIAPAGQG